MKNLKEALREERGFTLVELAIVLVIIGLLLAGALKGKDLMRNSYLQSFFKGKIQGVITSTNLLKDKLGYLPDCYSAEIRTSTSYDSTTDTCSGGSIPTGGTPRVWTYAYNSPCVYYYAGVEFPDLDDDGLRYDTQNIYFKKFSGGREYFYGYITTGEALRTWRGGSTTTYEHCSQRDNAADLCTYIDRLMDGSPNAAVGKVRGHIQGGTVTSKSQWFGNTDKLDGFYIYE